MKINYLKKALIIILALSLLTALAVCLTACGQKQATKESNVSIANPWVDTNKEGVQEATGFNINIPSEATNAQYSFMNTCDMAQATYDYDGHEWTFRMQKTDKLIDISGLYYEWNYQGSAMVSGKEAMEYAYVEGTDDSGMIDDLYGIQLINWYDDNTCITYSLSVTGKDLNGMDLQVIAEQLYNLEK